MVGPNVNYSHISRYNGNFGNALSSRNCDVRNDFAKDSITIPVGQSLLGFRVVPEGVKQLGQWGFEWFSSLLDVLA